MGADGGTVRLLTWNVQGRARPDLGALAAELEAAAAHVVVLQEVQRRQARHLAGALGLQVAWRFKHWPVVLRPEGLAILAPKRLRDVERIVLASGWRFWSSRRRVALAATTDGLRVVDVHLGSGVDEDERARQASLVADRGDVVAGDLNTYPGSPTTDVLRRAGLRDAWAEVGDGPGHTNWRRRDRTEPPVQRLDYVMVRDGWRVVGAHVPGTDAPGFERWGRLSDHLPVTVTLERR